MPLPDFSTLTLPELRAWDAALRAAIAAVEASGGGVDFIADDDGVSVVLFFPFQPEDCANAPLFPSAPPSGADDLP